MSAWEARASCIGKPVSMFFPERYLPDAVKPALKVCAGCPVREECRQAHCRDKYGVAGGQTPNDRRRAWRAALKKAA